MKNAFYVDFITDVCKDLDIAIVGENEPLVYFIPNENGRETLPFVTALGQPILLPSFKNTKSLVSLESSGDVKLEKILFSPLPEESIVAETQSFKALKERIIFKLNVSIYELGHMLLSLAKDDTKVKKLNIDLERFLSEAGKGETRGVRNLVDEDTCKKWTKICTKPKLGYQYPLLNIFCNRNVTLDGQKYKRIASIDFPLGLALDSADTGQDNTFNGVKLRNKDLVLFDAIFMTLAKKLGCKNYLYRVVSNHSDYPAFITLYTLYIDVMTAIKSLAKPLMDSFGSEFCLINTPLTYTSEEVVALIDKNIKELRTSINMLPTERSLRVYHPDTDETPKTNKEVEPEVKTSGVKVMESLIKEPEQPKPAPKATEYVPPRGYRAEEQVHHAHPEPQESSNVDSKAAAMFSTGGMGSPMGIYSNPNIAPYPQQPGSSFLRATSGYPTMPPTIGATNVTHGMQPMPVATPMAGQPYDQYGNTEYFPMATPVSHYGPMPGQPVSTMTMPGSPYPATTMPQPGYAVPATPQPGYGYSVPNMNMGMNVGYGQPQQPGFSRSGKNIYRK